MAELTLTRPDRGIPIILHPSHLPITVLLTAEKSQVVELHKHYDPDLSTLVPCQCEGYCASRRTCFYVPAWLRRHVHGTKQVWEEVVLRLTDLGWLSLCRGVIERDGVDGSIRGLLIDVSKRSATANAPQIVKIRDRLNIPEDRKPVDAQWVLLKRERIASNFFGAEENGPAPVKPRVPLGKRKSG